jgi:hypothetical protein
MSQENELDWPQRPAGTVVRRTIAPDASSAEFALLDIVADLEGCAIDELPSFYDAVGSFVGALYREPPSEESGMELQFSYVGYQVRLHQDGQVRVADVEAPTG